MDTATNTGSNTGVVIAHNPAASPAHLRPSTVTTTFIIFGLCLVALFVAGVAISATFAEADGVYIWGMVMFGAVVIAILLSGVFLPYIKEIKEHRRRG